MFSLITYHTFTYSLLTCLLQFYCFVSLQCKVCLVSWERINGDGEIWTEFQQFFHQQIRKQICNVSGERFPPHLYCVATLPCENWKSYPFLLELFITLHNCEYITAKRHQHFYWCSLSVQSVVNCWKCLTFTDAHTHTHIRTSVSLWGIVAKWPCGESLCVQRKLVGKRQDEHVGNRHFPTRP